MASPSLPRSQLRSCAHVDTPIASSFCFVWEPMPGSVETGSSAIASRPSSTLRRAYSPSGFARFDRYARALMQAILPDRPIETVQADDAILHSLYDIQAMRDAGTQQPRAVELYKMTLDGRAAIVYSPADTLGRLKGIHDPYANAYDQDSARRLALDILTYAMKR